MARRSSRRRFLVRVFSFRWMPARYFLMAGRCLGHRKPSAIFYFGSPHDGKREDTSVVDPRHPARLVRKERSDGSPLKLFSSFEAPVRELESGRSRCSQRRFQVRDGPESGHAADMSKATRMDPMPTSPCRGACRLRRPDVVLPLCTCSTGWVINSKETSNKILEE